MPSPPGATIPQKYAPGLSLFWVGYLTDLRRCLPLEVRSPGVRQTIRVTLSTHGGTCAQ